MFIAIHGNTLRENTIFLNLFTSYVGIIFSAIITMLPWWIGYDEYS